MTVPPHIMVFHILRSISSPFHSPLQFIELQCDTGHMTQDPQWREGTGEAGGGRPGTDVSVLVEDASLMIGDVI